MMSSAPPLLLVPAVGKDPCTPGTAGKLLGTLGVALEFCYPVVLEFRLVEQIKTCNFSEEKILIFFMSVRKVMFAREEAPPGLPLFMSSW